MSTPADPFLAFQAPSFLYVKTPAAQGVEGDDRSLDEAIDALLREAAVGAVLGWGSSLGAAQADGTRPVAFHRIDIQVRDLASARSSLHAALPGLGAPAGTEVHYFIEGVHRLDVYAPAGWQLAQAPGGR
jgi:hypothetical protein